MGERPCRQCAGAFFVEKALQAERNRDIINVVWVSGDRAGRCAGQRARVAKGDGGNTLDRIVNSLLETDAYKFSMGQGIYHQFSDYKTTWSFKCRNEDVFFTPEMVEEIKRQVQLYCDLRFNEDELAYLENIKWIKGSYVDFLRLWKPRFADFTFGTDDPCGLTIETRGTWLNTSMYEIPLLAIERLSQEEIPGSKFVGTSNVFLAKKYGVTPVGTMAHEWIMCVGQGNHKHNPAYSNWYALDAWVKEYGVLNGTALTDTITTDCFLKDFQLTYSTLFSGVRHDSGSPYEWGDKLLAHYKELGIDATQKTLLFSDSLDFARATEILRYFKGKAKVAFGIGTYISNDTFAEPLNIVMKMTACNGMDVAKLSDVKGKGICKNPDYLHYLERCIEWRMNH